VAVQKPRNRILIFRLTEDEYESLQVASTGARSMSEFARAKLLGSLAPPSTHVDTQLDEIRTSVARLAELLEKSAGEELT
jgi:hypothetical protein